MISVRNHQQPLSGNKLKHSGTRGEKFKYFSLPVFCHPLKPFQFLILAIFLLSACSPKTAPVNKNPETGKTESKPVEKQEEKKEEIKNTAKPKEKPEMVISLILPFELKSIDYKTATQTDLRKAEIAIDFYQGFKFGLDSAIKSSNAVNFKLQVYDSNDNPASLSILASKEAIKNSDLIVGPVFPNGIKAFSTYSQNMKKYLVSPLAASDPETFNNPYLITINNFIDLHAYKAVDFIKKELKPKKVIMVRSGQADEYKYAVPFKKGLDSLGKGLNFSEIGIKAVGYENVYKHLNPTGLNVIVLPATDRVFLLTILKELEKLKSNFQIAIVGHPSWERLAFLDFQQLEYLNTYLTSSYQIDYQSFKVSDFVKGYRYKFQVEPSEYAFKGFDIAYYFANLMIDQEHDFMKSIDKSYTGLHNQFDFVYNAKFGYYNTDLMVVKYQAGQLRLVD